MRTSTPWLVLQSLLLVLATLACMSDAAERDTTPPVEPPDLGTHDLSGPEPAPIEAPDEQWTWIVLDETTCGDGQPTGIGVNLSSRSDDVLIFLQGGGACWDVTSCFVLKAAANLETGYKQVHFEREATLGASPFDRSNPENPFKDATFVFIPYCTGDLHAGDKIERYEALGQTRAIHHRGAYNIETIARALAAKLPGERTVWLTGTSAGGYGAQLNYHRFAEAMPQAHIHALSDCGPLLNPVSPRWSEMKRAWSMRFPDGCSTCEEGLPNVLEHLIASYPERRFGLLAYEADQVIAVYFNYALDGAYPRSMNRLLDAHYEGKDNTRAFVLAGTEHVMLNRFATLRAPNGGPRLIDWIGAWARGDAANWETVRP